ncbi:T-complex protein 11 [Mortierella claussenii]|nr:T-complex protein 11 [Mortierella claussenii]
MPARTRDTIPSFIHLEQHQQRQHPSHYASSRQPQPQQRPSQHLALNNKDIDSVEQTTALLMKRFSISRGPQHHLHATSRRGGRRSVTSRVRGKHGLVKSMYASLSPPYVSGLRNHALSSNYSNVPGWVGEEGPFNKETRLAHLKKYMQTRRQRLRQRYLCRNDPLDASDMSLDEADVMEDENDIDASDHEMRDSNIDNGGNDVFTLDQEQYHRYIRALEQRLWERSRSAAKSRSHFLMERQLSASERVDHVQRVVQRQRTEQENRQHRARDELEQKMMRAMARRNAYLEAAIENDPSRRFRRKSTATANGSNSNNNNISKVSSAAIPRANKSDEPSKFSTKDLNRATMTKTKPSSSSASTRSPRMKASNEARGQGSTKNSPFNMTQATDDKRHLTSMTSDKCISPSSVTVTTTKMETATTEALCTRVTTTQLHGHEQVNYERLVQRASREYMKAIGGSHQRVLKMGFDELARLLHTNKNLIQATVRLLKYSSLLAQLARGDAAAVDASGSASPLHNPARVFLSMYMVVAHPSQIRSPVEPQQQHPATSQPNDEAFDSLVESSKALLEALQTWLAASSSYGQKHTQEQLQDNTPLQAAASSDMVTTSADKQHLHLDPALAKSFDDAWTSYYRFFQAWKERDAQRLLQTLLDHAQHIEALWRTVRSDPSTRLEWEPRIEEQRQDLRAKAGQLAGPEGAARLDSVFADFVHTTTMATVLLGTEDTTTRVTTPTAASLAPTESTSPVAKKRQRASSVSKKDVDTSTALVEGASAADSGLRPVRLTTSTESGASIGTTMASADTERPPKSKKPATTTAAEAAAMEAVPTGFQKAGRWTNLQLIHELAVDAGFKIEPRRPPGTTDSGTRGSMPLFSSGTSYQEESESNGDTSGPQSLQARIRAMATKAFFDKIREDSEQGHLGKWIPSLMMEIREHLEDMVPPGSAMAAQITEGFDIEFVKQQVDKNIYDIKGALKGILDLMAKLCAPVRDPNIRQIQENLDKISRDSLWQTTTPSTMEASSSSTSKEYSATAIAPKDLVSVLQDIMALLDVMLLDMTNFRLTMARPKLEKQAIPYEQNAFKDAVGNHEVSLDTTRAWLEASATKVFTKAASSASSASSAAATATATMTGAESEHTNSVESASLFVGRRRHYEILVHAMLDLIFSAKHFDYGVDRDQFPATLNLDRERMTRFQNEVQGLAVAAVIMNISTNVAPALKETEETELKDALLKLLEAPNTSRESLAEAVIEAKERTLLLAAREVGRSSSPSSPSPSITGSSAATSKLLLSEEQKSYVLNAITRSVSFESTLFRVLTQRLRQVLEEYIISTGESGGKSGVLPARAVLSKMGLAILTKEIDTLGSQIRFLTKYNAQVYRQWYDPILSKIVTAFTSTTVAAGASAAAVGSDTSTVTTEDSRSRTTNSTAASSSTPSSSSTTSASASASA